MVPFIFANDGSIVLVIDGRQVSVPTSHPNYTEISNNLTDKDMIVELLEVALPEEINDEDFNIIHGLVCYKGEPIHGTVAERIQEFLAKGLPITGLMKFLANCKRNPDGAATTGLYEFLAHGGFPMTENGTFIGYKAVQSDFFVKHTGKINCAPGNVIEMDRADVNSDRNVACSTGLHVGTLEYALGYFARGDDKIILVEVNPADVVSVPYDYNNEKLRCCRYVCHSEYTDHERISSPLVESKDTAEERFNDLVELICDIYGLRYQDVNDLLIKYPRFEEEVRATAEKGIYSDEDWFSQVSEPLNFILDSGDVLHTMINVVTFTEEQIDQLGHKGVSSSAETVVRFDDEAYDEYDDYYGDYYEDDDY